MEKIFDTKTIYTQDVLKEIKLYTLDKKSDEGAKVIGSLSYRSGNASDCDLFETVIRNNKSSLIKLFKEGIVKIVNDIMMSKNNYFLEVKLGLDRLFNSINYGRCAHNNYNVSPEYFNTMRFLYSKKLITKDEMSKIELIERTSPKQQLEFEIIKDIMRKRTVLRWTAQEIFNGYKILTDLNGRYKYTIEEAVCDKSQINIEGIFITSENIYSDCSNFFVLEYTGNDGIMHMLNLSDEALYDAYNYRRENLKESTYTLMYSELHPNLFKSLKRMLSYGKSFKMIDLIEKVYPLINSQLGNLYQMTSQMKTVMKIIKEHGIKPLQIQPIYNQLDKIRFKLQDLIFINHDFSDVFNLIDIVLSSNEYINKVDLADKLHEITDNLLSFINQQTYENMEKAGLYPLPQYLIPKNKPF